ncbi:NYN domain-containing protein [Georgenia yuyongxinii]
MSSNFTDTVVTASSQTLRSALFVDFDNVYSGLRQLDPEAAEAFATNPGRWVDNLEAVSAAQGIGRRFLVRRCYLNPGAYARFRPFFTRAGFRVVDCPSLTQQGKSSADINLVLDAVDALSANTRYDEFIIASSDADFTPLVDRCRADDRRVVVIAAGQTASAYRAVADTVVAADQLAEMVLARLPRRGPDEVAPEPPPSEKVPPAGNEQVPRTETALTSVTGGPGATPTSAVESVLAVLRSSAGPVYSPVVAHAAQVADPELRPANWGGFGSFAAWLQRTVPGVGYSPRPVPGYVWDSQRFTKGDIPDDHPDDGDTWPLTPLQVQVARVTDTPRLPADTYRTVYEVLEEDLSAHAFQRNETTKRVRDVCRDRGAGVSRGNLNFIIQGLLYTKGSLQPDEGAVDLGNAFAESVLQLCRSAQMELSVQDEVDIRDWVSGLRQPDSRSVRAAP